MGQEDAFLQAIFEEPDDDTHRLVYADWLEEHGRPERAEFLRVQVELAALGEGDGRRASLEPRERELLARHEGDWAAGLPGLVDFWVFRRGFVEEVGLSAREFLARARDLFRLAPVREVHLDGF